MIAAELAKPVLAQENNCAIITWIPIARKTTEYCPRWMNSGKIPADSSRDLVWLGKLWKTAALDHAVLKSDSKCSFTSCKLRFFFWFRLAWPSLASLFQNFLKETLINSADEMKHEAHGTTATGTYQQDRRGSKYRATKWFARIVN